MGVGRRGARKRAVGTRERIIAYLTEAGELFDQNGMASTQLAAAVGYPGSSVAFAQLLSGMERSGLIKREVRGKRTYRIGLGKAASSAMRSGPDEIGGAGAISGVGGVGGLGELGAAAGTAGFDYDELARRLLVQVVRRLAAAEPGAPGPEPPDQPDKPGQARLEPARQESARQESARQESALRETVTGLEYELATAWTKHGKLAEENVRLREQLRAAQRSLALAAERVRRLPVTTDLDSREVMVLQRLLSDGSGAAEAADLEDAGSLLS